jgi:hypothetical protein
VRRAAHFGPIVVAITQDQPKGAIIAQHVTYFAEYLDQLFDDSWGLDSRPIWSSIHSTPHWQRLRAPALLPRPDGVLFSGRRERFIGRCAGAARGVVAATTDMLARRITTDPFAGPVVAFVEVRRAADTAVYGFVRQRRQECEAIAIDKAQRISMATTTLIARVPTSL